MAESSIQSSRLTPSEIRGHALLKQKAINQANVREISPVFFAVKILMLISSGGLIT